MNGAEKFFYSEYEVKKVLKVFAWTMASAIVALLISLMKIVEFPIEYAFIVPIINTVLYALSELVKDNTSVSSL